MEADLQRFYGIDYRDRWRDGGRLTLRRLYVLLANLPPESALAALERDGKPDIRLEHVMLGDIWQATARSRKPHPLISDARRDARKKKAITPARRKKLADARRRAHARKAGG